MTDVVGALAAAGGIAHVRELNQAAIPSHAVEAAARRGEVVRIRRGWYASVGSDPQAIRAVRAGGTLTCASASVAHGMWSPPDARLHVALRQGTAVVRHPDTGIPLPDFRAPAGVVFHWHQADRTGGGVSPLLQSIVMAAKCLPEEFVFAMIESALRRRLISRRELDSGGRRVAALAATARSDADSGSESVFRFRLARLGIPMQSQVEIPGVGRVDFVIGDRLVIEIDSAAHHGGEDSRRRDLARDIALAALGGNSLRIDHAQIFGDWAAVESAVLGMLAVGGHRAIRPRASSG